MTYARRYRSLASGMVLAGLGLGNAMPALAANPVPVKAECSANKIGWAEPREFTVNFERRSNNLKNVEVSEQQRVFTPTDAKAIYTAGKRGGIIVDVPNQRPGKWEGKVNGEVEEFTLKTKDGSASFAVTPDASDKTLRALTWKAEMRGEDGQMLVAEGSGTCRVVSTEADVPSASEAAAAPAPEAAAAPAPEAAAAPTPEAAEAPAPKKPRREIRLFGGRKATSPEGETSK